VDRCQSEFISAAATDNSLNVEEEKITLIYIYISGIKKKTLLRRHWNDGSQGVTIPK
jgi:hypothetical protein